MLAAKDELFTRPSGGYTIARSVRLRSSATGNFSRTFGTPTSNTTWTWSAWVKRGVLTQASDASLFVGSDYTGIYFKGASSDAITFYKPTAYVFTSTPVYRDPSAWYHIVVSSNGTTVALYVNGVSAGSYTGTLPNLNSAVAHKIGVDSGSVSKFDGYLTEINFIDGQALTPSSFGSTNAITGVWQPAKYTGTYGTNGFYLNFSDNSNNTATTIGKDYSGNGNNWTPNNISVTAGVTYDSMQDVPTLTSATAANYATLNPLRPTGSGGFSNGNLTGTAETGTSRGLTSTIVLPYTGKWYAEVTFASSIYNWCGVTAVDFLAADINTAGQMSVLYYANNGNKYVNGTGSAYGASYTTETIGIAFDGVAGTITFYKANTSQGAITLPSSTVNYVFCQGNAGGVAIAANWNFGQQPWTYTPPTGYVALNTFNLPASTITNGAKYMAASTYTGNLTGQSITNGGNNTLGTTFQPDLVWIKSRSAATDNKLTDSVRGATKALISNTTGAETTDTTGVTAFNSNGFTLGISTVYNNTATTYVAWQWQAGASAGSSNTNGSITSTVSAGATQGFSVCTFNAGSAGNQSFGHGLGVVPSFVIIKDKQATTNWVVYHSSATTTTSQYLVLNTTAAIATASGIWGAALPTSSVVGFGSNVAVLANNNCVAYCFAAVAGYSAFGSYTGNGSTDGPFVYLGFRPRFVMVKRTDVADDWVIVNSSMAGYNGNTGELYPDLTNSEGIAPGTRCDLLSNGFKVLASNAYWNASTGTYIYAAFAENPFKNSLAR